MPTSSPFREGGSMRCAQDQRVGVGQTAEHRGILDCERDGDDAARFRPCG